MWCSHNCGTLHWGSGLNSCVASVFTGCLLPLSVRCLVLDAVEKYLSIECLSVQVQCSHSFYPLFLSLWIPEWLFAKCSSVLLSWALVLPVCCWVDWIGQRGTEWVCELPAGSENELDKRNEAEPKSKLYPKTKPEMLFRAQGTNSVRWWFCASSLWVSLITHSHLIPL